MKGREKGMTKKAPGYVESFRIKTDDILKYKSRYQSQLEADVFFTRMDSSPHLLRVRVFVQTTEANVRQHPYYTIATFAKYAPPTCGPHFRYSHLEHDDIAIANDLGANTQSLDATCSA